MTIEQIKAEIDQLNQDWENYLDNTPDNIKHEIGADGKTDILRRYSAIIQRKQELYKIHHDMHRHIVYYDIKPWPKRNGA